MNALRDAIRYSLVLSHDGTSEDFVREEVLVPLFYALGYRADSVYRIDRGVRLSRTILNAQICSNRHHTLPDIILRVLDKMVWVIEAKSTRVPLITRKNAEQVKAYLQAMFPQCRYGALTNGREFAIFKALPTGAVRHIGTVHLGKVLQTKSGLRVFTRLFSPAHAYLRGRTYDDILALYLNGNWLIRNVCMDVLRSLNDVQRDSLKGSVEAWSKGESTRERSLPAIVFAADKYEMKRVAEISLGDHTDTVQDTFFTIVRSHATHHKGFICEFDLSTCVPRGWFSRAVYLQTVAAVLKGGCVRNKKEKAHLDRTIRLLSRDPNYFVKAFADLAERRVTTPFPFVPFVSREPPSNLHRDIEVLLMETTLQQVVDADYAPESRQSALDAIQEWKRRHGVEPLPSGGCFTADHQRTLDRVNETCSIVEL